MPRSLISGGVCGLAMLGLAGCVSVLPTPISPDALYRIDAATSRPQLPVNLLIREPDAPQIVSGRALISEDSRGALRLVPAVEWAGRSTQLLQSALVDSFAAGPGGMAVLPDAGILTAYELVSRVQAFELHGQEARCDMSVSVVTSPARDVLAHKEISVRRTSADDDMTARAEAMKRAGEACVAEISDFAASALDAAAAP